MDFIDLNEMDKLKQIYNIKNNITKTNEKLTNELKKIVDKTEEHFENATIEKSINWVTYKNTWLKNENGDLGTNFYNYERGDVILSIDLGTINIGTEIRYPHPCVVLFDNNEDWIIVAPITAAQIDWETGEPIVHEFEVYVEEQKKKPKNIKEFQFKKKSVIQVDQLSRVSKYRAVNKKRMKLRQDLLNQIDNIMIEKYIPKKYNLLEKIKEINESLSNEIKKLNYNLLEDAKNKELEINRLLKRINELENEKSN